MKSLLYLYSNFFLLNFIIHKLIFNDQSFARNMISFFYVLVYLSYFYQNHNAKRCSFIVLIILLMRLLLLFLNLPNYSFN
jgi:hypothetical protein